MSNLTRTQVAKIRSDLMDAMKGVAQKHGVDFALGTIGFSPEKMSVKLTAVVRGAGGTAVNKPTDATALALAKVGKYFLGDKFDSNQTYLSQNLGPVTVIGYNSRAHAYPYVVQTTSGKKYKLSADAVKRMIV